MPRELGREKREGKKCQESQQISCKAGESPDVAKVSNRLNLLKLHQAQLRAESV